MGTEGTRRRNRNRRLRKKGQKTDKKRRSLIIICITYGIIALLIGKVELENIFLYEQGQTAKAYVYRHTSKGRRGVSLYEFRVDGIRYTGQDQNSEVGNYIEIAYLPQNPKINRNAKVLDKDWCVLLYRKIIE